MPIVASCPACKVRVSVKDALAGKRIVCPRCKKGVIQIPAAGAAPQAQRARPPAQQQRRTAPQQQMMGRGGPGMQPQGQGQMQQFAPGQPGMPGQYPQQPPTQLPAYQQQMRQQQQMQQQLQQQQFQQQSPQQGQTQQPPQPQSSSAFELELESPPKPPAPVAPSVPMVGTGEGIMSREATVVSDGVVDTSELPQLDSGAQDITPRRCPRCSRPVEIGKFICSNCGWDSRKPFQRQVQGNVSLVPYVAGGVLIGVIIAMVVILMLMRGIN